MKEILPELESWKRDGETVVVATVVATRRSAPRPLGSSLAISESGKMCGSVSGGCVESDVYENAQEVFETGRPKLVSYGISDDLAWSVGLPCGGEIDVFLERGQVLHGASQVHDARPDPRFSNGSAPSPPRASAGSSSPSSTGTAPARSCSSSSRASASARGRRKRPRRRPR